MNGAREYASIFSSGQYGRLYFVAGSHARGSTFQIYVLPAGEAAIGTRGFDPGNPDTVEVYGVVGGNPGWTEYYGWLHDGAWQGDFAELVVQRRKEIEAKWARDQAAKVESEKRTAGRKKELLSSY